MVARETTEELDRAFVWHPFTRMGEWLEGEPLAIASASGAWLVDEAGRRYLDGVSSLWTNVHGHCHPAIDGAIREQLGKVAHTTLLGLAHRPAAELAAELARLSKLARVFYSDSGSTAVEVALKIAFEYHRCRGELRPLFVHLEGSYHGDTLGAVAVGGIPQFHEVFGPITAPVRAAIPAPRKPARS